MSTISETPGLPPGIPQIPISSTPEVKQENPPALPNPNAVLFNKFSTDFSEPFYKDLKAKKTVAISPSEIDAIKADVDRKGLSELFATYGVEKVLFAASDTLRSKIEDGFREELKEYKKLNDLQFILLYNYYRLGLVSNEIMDQLIVMIQKSKPCYISSALLERLRPHAATKIEPMKEPTDLDRDLSFQQLAEKYDDDIFLFSNDFLRPKVELWVETMVDSIKKESGDEQSIPMHIHHLLMYHQVGLISNETMNRCVEAIRESENPSNTLFKDYLKVLWPATAKTAEQKPGHCSFFSRINRFFCPLRR